MVSETPTQPKRQNAAAVANSIPELKAKAAMVVESLANGDMAKKSKEFVDEKVNQVSSQSISTVLLQVLYFAAAKVFSVIMFLLSLVPEPAQKWFEKRVMTDNRDIL
jgi:hypothetical protein